MRLRSIHIRLFSPLWPMLSLPLIAASPAITPASLPVGSGANGFADGVTRTVGSILEYSHWPAQGASNQNPVRLCVVGHADYAAGFDRLVLPGGRAVRRVLPLTGTTAASCDALYIGAMRQSAMQQVLASVRGAAVVTIAEADPQCRSEAMFCLLFEPHTISFQLNIDAVSRSTVTIDPRVLRLSRGF